MIKLKKLLEETDPLKWAKASAEKLLFALKHDCIDIGTKGKILYRAYKYDKIGTYERKTIRTDRRPKDTASLPNIIAEAVRNLYYPSKPSRYSSLFCSYRMLTARSYASGNEDVYYIFPEKGCKLYMYPHDDSVDVFGTGYFTMNEIPEDATAEGIAAELGLSGDVTTIRALRFSLPYIRQLIKLKISNADADLYDYFYKNFVNIFGACKQFNQIVGVTRPNGFSLDTVYSIGNLRYLPSKIKEYFEEIVKIKDGDDAIESGHEIYVEGDAYYIVNRDFYDDWIIYNEKTGEYSLKSHPYTEPDTPAYTDSPRTDTWSHGDMS